MEWEWDWVLWTSWRLLAHRPAPPSNRSLRNCLSRDKGKYKGQNKKYGEMRTRMNKNPRIFKRKSVPSKITNLLQFRSWDSNGIDGATGHIGALSKWTLYLDSCQERSWLIKDHASCFNCFSLTAVFGRLSMLLCLRLVRVHPHAILQVFFQNYLVEYFTV